MFRKNAAHWVIHQMQITHYSNNDPFFVCLFVSSESVAWSSTAALTDYERMYCSSLLWSRFQKWVFSPTLAFFSNRSLHICVWETWYNCNGCILNCWKLKTALNLFLLFWLLFVSQLQTESALVAVELWKGFLLLSVDAKGTPGPAPWGPSTEHRIVLPSSWHRWFLKKILWQTNKDSFHTSASYPALSQN